MATAGNGISLTTAANVVFDASAGDKGNGPCTAIFVSNRSSSSGNVLVNIPGLHAAGDFAGIAPGVSQAFRVGVTGLSKITLKSDSTATADWGISANL